MNSENIFNQHDIVEKLFEIANESNYIDPNYYNQYNVKRGLRNSNGTGVLVGLTNIGDVHGYICAAASTRFFCLGLAGVQAHGCIL